MTKDSSETHEDVDLFGSVEIDTPEPDADSKKEAVKAAPKKRRDIKDLNETCKNLKQGDYITAGFTSKRYGSFTITGTTVLMMDKKSLVVGSWIVSNEGKPAKQLQTLVLEAEAGTHDHIIIAGDENQEDYGSN